MTETVTVTRRIGASPAALWKLVSDVTRMGEWSTETIACSWMKGASGPAVGARFKGRNANGKKSWSTVSEIVECDPASTFVFESKAGPVRIARWSYRFEPEGEGTRVTETWEDQRSGWFMPVSGFVSGVSDRTEHNRAGMQDTLERLAASVET